MLNYILNVQKGGESVNYRYKIVSLELAISLLFRNICFTILDTINQNHCTKASMDTILL